LGQQVKLPEDNNDPWECASSFENDTLLAGLIKALNETLHQKEDKKLEETEETLEFFCFGCKEVVTAESAVEKHRKSTCDCVKLKKACVIKRFVFVLNNRRNLFQFVVCFRFLWCAKSIF
jgi:hypothetical protein